MPITIAGSGTITGISAGGLPDGVITTDDIAANAVTTAKLADANTTAAKLSGGQAGSAPAYAARAWVEFDGDGTVGTGRANGNVSSITDHGTGDYTITFTTAMPDANYACAGMTNSFATSGGNVCSIVTLRGTQTSVTDKLAGSCRINTGNSSSGAFADFDVVTFIVFR